MLFILLQCLNHWKQPDSYYRIKSSSCIRVGFALEGPYAMLDAAGHPTGESIETARLIIQHLGIKNTEWYLSNFSALIPRLLNNEIDIIASGMFITASRSLLVNFSEPSLIMDEALVVRQGNPLQITSYESLAANASARVVLLDGGFSEDLMPGLSIAPDRLIEVQDINTGLNMLSHSEADAFPMTIAAALNPQNSFDPEQFAIISSLSTLINYLPEKTGAGAFAFRKDDKNLLHYWNESQRNVLGSPEHITILKKFGLSEKNLPKNENGNRQ
ncbi:MAG TPA: transporter substrate-binding domain-containing protein [Candidatus Rifleibacterium sp.]|nr:transporter substrate-binding domain-containing protein [Candidatus Rifleibacterium sp.]